MSVTRRGGRPRVAPRALDPVLSLVERIDRWRRRIRPVRPGSLLGVERGRYRGPGLDLGGDVRLAAAERIWVLHLDNARLRALLSGPDLWPSRAYDVAAADLRAVAGRLAALPPAERPVALGGVTVLAPLARRLGFEVFPRPRTARVRLEDWYLRSLLARWAPTGRARLVRGHGALRTSATWISTPELLRRYGPPPE